MNKLAIVTGGTSEIGLCVATGLAKERYEVVVVARNQDKALLARQDIERTVGPDARVHIELANLASLDSVEALAERIVRTFPEASLLVNGAGVLAAKKAFSEDGIEMDLAVNHVAPFLLIWHLFPILQQQDGARIINVNSDSHEKATLEPADLDLATPFRMWAAYGKSKLANVATTVEFASRLSPGTVTINAVHPGFVATNIGNTGGIMQLAWLMMKPYLLTPQQGAQTPLWAATSPLLAGVTGNYYKKQALAQMNPLAQRPSVRDFVWTCTLELARLPQDAQLTR